MRFFYLFAALTLTTRYASAGACTSSRNLVNNCGFETGDLTGWTLSGPQSGPADLGITYGVDTSDAHSGNYGAYLGGFGVFVSLSQSLATVPGVSYIVSYYLAQSPATVSPYVSGFDTYFGSSTLFAAGNAPNLPFTLYSFATTATSSLSTLTFSARDDTGFFSLDDISVTAVPEPAGFLLLAAPFALAFARRWHRA